MRAKREGFGRARVAMLSVRRVGYVPWVLGWLRCLGYGQSLFIVLHVAPGGWYSHGVLVRALQNTIPRQWFLRLAPLLDCELDDFFANPKTCGALLNVHNLHWIAIVKHNGFIWHVDSLRVPRPLRPRELQNMLRCFPTTFPLCLEEYPE